MTTRSTLAQPQTDDYRDIEPLPDPPRKHDMLQRDSLSTIDGTLRAHFAGRSDVLVCGDGYLRRDSNDSGDFVPDSVFVDGVDPRRIIRRNGYVISEVGKPPAFVLEVGSRSTGRRDYTVKREGYAALGVGEYWRFDPTGGQYHDAPLAGDALVDGEYVALETVSESDGRSWGYSEALGLELWWDEGELRFRDPASGAFLLTPEEWQAAQDVERAAREAAEERADEERMAREAAEERLAGLESELRQLRGEP